MYEFGQFSNEQKWTINGRLLYVRKISQKVGKMREKRNKQSNSFSFPANSDQRSNRNDLLESRREALHQRLRSITWWVLTDRLIVVKPIRGGSKNFHDSVFNKLKCDNAQKWAWQIRLELIFKRANEQWKFFSQTRSLFTKSTANCPIRIEVFAVAFYNFEV